MSAPYRRTNEDRRNAVTGFFGALMGNPIAQGVISPELGVANLARQIADNTTITNVGQTISPQQAEIRQRQAQQRGANDLAGRHLVQQWINNGGNTSVGTQNLAELGVDTSNPNPPAGLDKAAASGRLPIIGNALNLAQQAQQTAGQQSGPRLANGQPANPGFTGGSFANMAQQAAQIQADGGQLPFQDMKQEEIIPSFNKASGTGGTRFTEWDTKDIYAVVSKMSMDDYDELESIQTKEELVDLSSDTTINLLEDSGIIMSPELEASFKAGIGPAMDDWYQQQVAGRKSTDMTSYMMGMTQFALTLIDTYGEGGGTPQVPTTNAAVQGTPTEEQFITQYGQGQIPPEFYQGFEAWLESNPSGSYQDFLAAMGAQ